MLGLTPAAPMAAEINWVFQLSYESPALSAAVLSTPTRRPAVALSPCVDPLRAYTQQRHSMLPDRFHHVDPPSPSKIFTVGGCCLLLQRLSSMPASYFFQHFWASEMQSRRQPEPKANVGPTIGQATSDPLKITGASGRPLPSKRKRMQPL